MSETPPLSAVAAYRAALGLPANAVSSRLVVHPAVSRFAEISVSYAVATRWLSVDWLESAVRFVHGDHPYAVKSPDS
jgi:hypothetical protein